MTRCPTTTIVVVVQTQTMNLLLLLVVVKPPQTAAVWKKRKTTPNGRFLVLACLSTMTEGGEEVIKILLIQVMYYLYDERWSGTAPSA
jgi:hypothetical protein